MVTPLLSFFSTVCVFYYRNTGLSLAKITVSFYFCRFIIHTKAKTLIGYQYVL